MPLFSQNRCSVKKICGNERFGDFDYRSQSSYTQISSGDTLTINMIAYADQEFRIFTCFDEKNKDGYFKLYNVKTTSVKKIKLISGNDTIFEIKRIQNPEEFYDSRKSENKYWQSKITKTTRMYVKIIAPPTNNIREGCVNVMIGRLLEN
jgi:hypothetical protein